MLKLRNHSLLGNMLYHRRKVKTNTTIKATAERPRLLVVRSNSHIRAQIIGMDGKVIATAHDLAMTSGNKSERAFAVGQAVAALALAKQLKEVVFDRNGFLYHGRVKQLADGARAGGLVL